MRKPQDHAGNKHLEDQFRRDPRRPVLVHNGAHQGICFFCNAEPDGGDRRYDVEEADKIINNDGGKGDRHIPLASAGDRGVFGDFRSALA